MMEPKQKATWAEIDVGALVTPDFVKACIRWVTPRVIQFDESNLIMIYQL